MICKKCGCSSIRMIRDSRGLPEAHCAECGSVIKKMSTGEVIEYFEELLEETRNSSASGDFKPETTKPLCKYCTEDWYIRNGRLGMTYRKMDITVCPMCGRKIQPDDRRY